MNIHLKTIRWLQLFFISSALILGGNSYADSSKQVKAWGYSGEKGPKAWGTLSPAYATCTLGKHQSPININTQRVIPTQNGNLNIHYQPIVPLNVVSDGTTRLNIDGHKMIINDGHTVQINFPQTQPLEFITVKKQRYHLLQFHIHSPSETLINGKSFPLEIHFVNQDTKGKVAVIAVFVQLGKFNPAVETLLKHLPPTKGQPYPMESAKLRVNSLVPKNKSYYSFLGSLTTPPCTEGLQWFVMLNPIEASKKQITALKKALPLVNNARPTQSLNERKILLFLEKD